MTVRVARNLQRLGCVKGKKLFVFIGNVPEVAQIVFAAICSGCTIVSIATNSSQAECEYFLKLTKPEFVICHTKFHSMLKQCFENLNINAKIITDIGQTEDSVKDDDDDAYFE